MSVSNAWLEALNTTLENLSYTIEAITSGDYEGLETEDSCKKLAQGMSRTALSFTGPGDERANWIIGGGISIASSDAIYFNSDAAAGPGVFLLLPLLLNESSYQAFVTSLGIGAWSNSFGFISTIWNDSDEIMNAQWRKSKKLSFKGHDNTFRFAHMLDEENLPATLKDIPGASEYVGEVLAMYFAEVAERFVVEGSLAVLQAADQSFDAMRQLWTRSIDILSSVEFD